MKKIRFYKRKKLSQMQIIAMGFFTIIAVGTVLLMMPFSSRNGEVTSLINALFTATSATCVTGLVIADTYQKWSVIGQLVILIMIQTGGLGFITIGVYFSIFLRKKIGLRERGLLQESVNAMEIGGIVKLLKKIVKGTFFFEICGAIILSIRFIPRMGVVTGIYNGIFHSVSAFCNAGFDLMGRYEAYSSFTDYYDDPVINITLMSLIVIGGLGFIVWDDLSKKKFDFRKYALHTKIVLSSTVVLIFGGALLFWIFENNKLMTDMSVSGKILSSLFSSVTARTAGFNTIDTGALSPGSLLLTIVLMYIGGSPGSTAGGIKTTTFVVMLVYITSNLKNTHGSNIFGRRLDDSVIKKACLVFSINLMLAITSTIIICGIQPIQLQDALFETFSAIGTVGMSTGITRDLTIVSKAIIVFLMYCGRIGSMTFALSFTQRKKAAPLQLPCEKVTIG